MNPGDLIFIDVSTDFSGSFLVSPGADLLVTLFVFHRLLGNPGRVLVQQLPQSLGKGFDVRLGLLQLVRVQIHVLHTHRGGQNVHVPVQDVPPVGGDGGGAGLVAQRLGGIVVILFNHQLVQPQTHRHKRQQPHHQHHQQNPPVLSTVQPQAVILWLCSSHTGLLQTN